MWTAMMVSVVVAGVVGVVAYDYCCSLGVIAIVEEAVAPESLPK